MAAARESRPSRNVGRSTGISRDRFRLSASFEGPAGEPERLLLRLWEEVLDVRGLGVLDDFFELGGDSFAATALIGEIDRVFSRALPPSVLLTHPSVRSLAALLARSGNSVDRHPLLPLRTSGDRQPLFVVHAAEGTALFVRRLLPHLDPGQPVYAIQGRGLIEGEEPHCRFEAMAADYAEVIRSVRPRGPYLLAGYCVGGLIALEIARMLKAAGEEVRFLAMIDPCLHPTVVPWLRWTNPDSASARLHRMVSRLLWHLKRRRLQVARRALGDSLGRSRDYKPVDIGRQRAVHAGARAALRAYRPLPYDGKVTIFFSTEHKADFEGNAGRSHALASRIDIVELGALHEHLFTTQTDALGRELQHRLDLLAEEMAGGLAA
jgi:thioesterase domain-containing protein